MRRLLISAHCGDALEVQEILDGSDPFLVNYADQLRQTALHFAAAAGQVDVAKILLQRGANVNAKDIDGGTPLSLASAKGHAAIVDLLLKFGADVEMRNFKRQTPLFCAAMAGAPDVFKLLVEFGANYNATNGHNRTPLDFPHLQCPTSIYVSIIEHHVTKMACAKLPYTKMAFYRPGVIDMDMKRSYRNKCIAELKRLEEFTLPGSKLSLHDFLIRPNSVHSYIRNPEICKIVTELDFIAEYPIYSGLLEQNLFRGLRRLALLENASCFFSVTQKFSGLPPECVEKVCSYLDNGPLSYLGLVWVWSRSKKTSVVHEVRSARRHSHLCLEVCTLAGVNRSKPWGRSIVGLCLNNYANPQLSNSIS